MNDRSNRFGVKTTMIALRRLFRHLRGHVTGYTIGLVLYGIGSDLSFNILFSFSFMLLFGAGEQGSLAMLKSGILFISIGFVVTALIFILGSLIFEISVARASGELRKKAFAHLNRLPAGWFEKSHSGDTVSRLTNDMQAAESAWGDSSRYLLQCLLSGAGSTVVLFILDWRFALIIIPLGAVLFYVSSRFIAPVKRRSDEVQQELAGMTESLVDLLASSRIIRLFNLSDWITSKIDRTIHRVYDTSMRRAYWLMGQASINNFAGTMTFIGGILIGTVFVLRGWFPFSKLVAMIQMGNGISQMFWRLGAVLTSLQTSLAGAERVLDMMDLPTESEAPAAGETPDGHEIRLDNVTFGYDRTSPVIRNLSLTISPGETVALVGESGGGKSTILKLLCGFYPPDEGKILIGGVAVEPRNLETIRGMIAYVPQTNYLFAGTVRDNIGFGRPGATDAEAESAAMTAAAHEFILDLSSGYETAVGERGAQLSGGQRQRIAVARALLKNAPILLLDEATSSLDSESELLVRKALDRLIAGRTSIIVAHRLSTIKHADRILVLEKGGIVEEGTHDELMDRNGRYAEYYRMGLPETQAQKID